MPPPELLTFVAAQWADCGGFDGCARARSDWCKDHGMWWPTGEYGDFIDCLKEIVDVKRRLAIEDGLRDRAN